MKRDILKEITIKHEKTGSDGIDLNYKSIVELLVKNRTDDNIDLLKGLVMVSVAKFENNNRIIIKELIDNNKHCFDNAVNYFSKSDTIKFDFSWFKAINENSVTLGQIISHQVKLNTIYDLLKILEAIIGVKPSIYLKTIRITRNTVYEFFDPKIKNKLDKVIYNINLLIRFRHESAHENNYQIEYNSSRIIEFIENLHDFSSLISLHADLILDNNIYYDRIRMNNYIYKKVNTSDLEIKNLIVELLKKKHSTQILKRGKILLDKYHEFRLLFSEELNEIEFGTFKDYITGLNMFEFNKKLIAFLVTLKNK